MGMQAVAVGKDQNLWHTIRNATGTWQSTLGEIEKVVAGGPPGFRQASSGSTDGQVLQVVALGSDGQLWHTLRDAQGAWQGDFGAVNQQSKGGPGQFSDVSCSAGANAS